MVVTEEQRGEQTQAEKTGGQRGKLVEGEVHMHQARKGGKW